MSAFTYTQLEEGEVVVIGPVTFSSSVSFSAGSGQQSAQLSRKNERKIGITNRRVIVEQGDQAQGAQIVANADVKRVYVRREKFGTKVEKIETQRGQTVKLDMAGLGPMDEARLFELFPSAEIGESKGLFGGFSKITPRPVAAPRVPPPPKPPAGVGASPAIKPAPAAAGWGGPGKSHIDDADIKTVEDLRRYYPLPKEYDYEQTAEGEYMVKRLSDGAQFPILLEEEMLGFDVPVQDPKRKKVTVEVIKKK
ncbi:MAG: hypothetical protein JW850_15145 [Thermoflexales bacterium]|nr:hypothetical protein [Thermoflexales bacterium]